MSLECLPVDWLPIHWLPCRGDPDEIATAVRPPGPVRVLIVEAEPLFAEFFVEILERDPNIAIVGVAPTADAALDETRAHAPEVVLGQMHAIAQDDYRLCDLLREQHPAVPILVIATDRDMERWVRAYTAGVRGWMHRGAIREMLPNAVHAVARGGYWFHPGCMIFLYDRDMGLSEGVETLEAELAEFKGPLSRLTRTEKELLADLVEGLTDAQICQRRSVSLATVKTHVRHILRKLEVGSRGEAAALARSLGFPRR